MIKRSNTDSLLSKIRIVEEARKALSVVKAVATCFSEPSQHRSAEEYPKAEQHGFYTALISHFYCDAVVVTRLRGRL